MKIQKYKGKSEKKLLETIKSELGSDAVILNIKHIKSNWFLKLLGQDSVEITAATDAQMAQPIVEAEKTAIQRVDPAFDELKDQINNMEKLLAHATDKMDKIYSKPQGGLAKTDDLARLETSKSKIEELIYEHLVGQEVEEEVAKSLLGERDELGENPKIQDVIRIVYNNISKTIGNVSIIEEKTDGTQGPQIVFFIGPTGVGKTTSIAKLTADFSLKKEKKLGLITADTYRIAAIEQLRTYAEILSVPLKVVYSPEELQNAIQAFQDKDFVFIDTAGRSHKNTEHIEELEDMLNQFPQKKVYLVLSATTKFTDLLSIVKKYSNLCEEYAIIITKTDETASAGTILNLKYFTGKALSYVSFGQNVPDDIEIVNGSKYAKILLGSLSDE